MTLREIHWEVTNECNLRCKHCLPMSGKPRVNELSVEEALRALDGFAAAGVSRLYFTGGEPFGRADILTLLHRAVALGMDADVITNATKLDDVAIKTASELGIRLGVSIDGADAATNDAIRGKGTFKRVIEALKRCQDAHVSVTLYTTVTGMNFGQLHALGMLAWEYECVSIHFSEVTLAGRALRFPMDLSLSTDQRSLLPETVARVASDVFGEKLSPPDERCWVDGTSLYMTADGNLYFCSEVFQRRPDLALGNIRSCQLQKWQEKKTSVYGQGQNRCCYGALVSDHVVLISNAAYDCTLAPTKRETVKTLAQLYDELEELYQGIEGDCRECKDPDCVGYVWLLKQETDKLYERGIPLVQINGGPSFIHSFPSNNKGQLDVSVRYPPCSQACTDSRRCKIHRDRPLVCRLYPLGLETRTDGTIVWALHRDCLYVRRLEEHGLLLNFKHRARSVVDRLSPQLLAEIIQAYRAVYAISTFPDGENNYHVLGEVNIAN